VTQIQAKDREERRVSKAKISLMRSKKFALWSGIMMMGDTKVVDDIPTACTNGRDEMYGRAFVASQNDKQVAFVVLHENLHKALRHLTTWKPLMKLDANLANQAMDYVINLIIVNTDPSGEHTQIPSIDGKEIALLDHKYTGMNTKQVFDLLKQEQDEGGGGKGSPLDEHDWEGAESLTEEEKEELSK
jgi:predicted metal-dependent peptidase